ncbi:MAG: hypothetical protein QOF66_4909 [Mycobacterium sp.]|nr:hypothetical protein [Mycobacterium sp.]
MAMLTVADGTVIADGQRWIRCTQNSTLGCNWLVVEEEQETHQRGRCLADSLIRREPDASDTIAREKLVPTAAALRRLVYQLLDIGLPIDPFWRHDGGLAFDLVSSYSKGERVVIGHANGVIAIDLVESLDAYRESLRVRLGEPYRTMLGHFRQEVGHYYQSVLVENGTGAERYLTACRELFGNEPAGYAGALDHHYKFGAPAGWRGLHLGVRNHASLGGLRRMFCPLSAHHRHHRDQPRDRHGAARRPIAVLRTPRCRPPRLLRGCTDRADVVRLDMYVAVLQPRQHRNGKDPLYPFEIPPTVVAKLRFVHRVLRETAAELSDTKEI